MSFGEVETSQQAIAELMTPEQSGVRRPSRPSWLAVTPPGETLSENSYTREAQKQGGVSKLMKVHNLSTSLNPLQLFRAPFQQQPQQAQPSRAGPRLEAKGQIPKTPSLLFDIELEDAPVPPESREDNETQGVLTNFRSLAVPWSKTEHELLAEWVATQEADPQQSSSEALTALAKRLRARGYPVSVRSALGGGWGGECLRNLRHSFLVCTVSGDKHPGVYIIDPAFREQFDLAHATPRYQQILEAIPSTFVGTEARLVALVCALCQEIQSVFLEQNATLPPWRDVAAQLSKWRPRRSMDHPILHNQDPSSPQTSANAGPQPQLSHDLNLVRTASKRASGMPESLSVDAGSKPLTQLQKLSPQLPRRSVSEGKELSTASSRGAGNNFYQLVAGPVAEFGQQLMSRRSQNGLLVSGL